MIPPPGMGPAPGKDPGRKRNNRRTGGGAGRVAYDRHKDRGFDFRMGRGRGRGRKKNKTQGQTELTVPKASKRVVKMEDTITVAELASQLSVKASEAIRWLMQQGEMVTVNHVLDMDTVTLIADQYSFTVENVSFDIDKFIPQLATDPEQLDDRDPVVTDPLQGKGQDTGGHTRATAADNARTLLHQRRNDARYFVVRL